VPNPQAIIDITPEGIAVTLRNWHGVSTVRLEQIAHQIQKANHQHFANEMQKTRVEEAKQREKEIGNV